MTKEEKNAFRFWRKFYLIVLIVAIIAVCLCSCDEVAQDGTVSAVIETSSVSNYKYEVQVKKFVTSAPLDGGDYYWFWTNDTLMVGDTIHIGKVN